jgi:hypothetical protein
MDTAVTTSKLKDAEPTITIGARVLGCSEWESPALRALKVLMIPRRISGADEPKANRVALAILGFQTDTPIVNEVPSFSLSII